MQIATETNATPSQSKYDTLSELFNRMSSFDPSLFHRLKEYVLNELGPKNQYEVEVFENYSKMLAETEMLIMCKKIKTASSSTFDTMGDAGLSGAGISRKLSMEEAKQAEEDALDNDKLCQICFNREMDTKYIPCQHTSCRVCIQTHMLNK